MLIAGNKEIVLRQTVSLMVQSHGLLGITFLSTCDRSPSLLYFLSRKYNVAVLGAANPSVIVIY